jgi:hypothetical protein
MVGPVLLSMVGSLMNPPAGGPLPYGSSPAFVLQGQPLDQGSDPVAFGAGSSGQGWQQDQGWGSGLRAIQGQAAPSGWHRIHRLWFTHTYLGDNIWRGAR